MGNNPVELAKKSDVTNHINNKNNPHQVKANQVVIGNAVSTELELEVGSNVDDALVTLNNTFEMINDSINGSGQNVTYWKLYKDSTIYDDSALRRSSRNEYTLGIDFYRTCTYNRETQEYELSNKAGTYNFKTSGNDTEMTEVIQTYNGCYFADLLIQSDGRTYSIFKITDDTVIDTDFYQSAGTYYRAIYVNNLVILKHAFEYIGSISDSDSSKYPNYAYSGDYYYVRQDGLSLSISKTMYSTLQTTSTNSAEIICEFSPKILILQDSAGNNVFFWIYGSSYLSYNTRQAASVSYDSDTNTINLTNMTSSLTNKTFNLVVIG